MKRERIAFLLLALMLVAGTLFASGGQQGASAAAAVSVNPTGYPIFNEKVTQTMFSVRAPIQGDWEQMPFWQIMEEKTNIHWTFDLVAPDVLSERKNLLIASGDYPDVFYGANFTGDEELNYGTQGILRELDSYITQYGPNIKKFFDANQIYRNMTNASNGKIYTLPRIEVAPRSTVATKLWINNVWLQNLGLAMPKTLDEYYNVLVAFRDRDPNQNGQQDEFPMSFAKGQLGQTRGAILAALGVMHRATFDVDVNGNVFFIYNSDAYRDYLTYMNKLFTEKLIDNESFIQTDQQYVAKGNQSLVGSFAHLASYLVDTMEHYPNYRAIPPMTSARNNTQMWPTDFPIYFGAFAITDKNKYPEAAIRWLDYCFTYEGGALLSQGPEGLGWKYIDDQRVMWDKTPVPQGFASAEEYRGTLTPNCGTNTPGYISGEFLLGLSAPHVVNLEEQVAAAYLPYMRDSFPIVKLTADEQKEAGVLSTDIFKYTEQMEARFITGDASLSTWDNYIRDLESMGAARLTEIHQVAYNRSIGK